MEPQDYVAVVLDDAPPRAGGVWTYAVPPPLRGSLRVGCRVEVPFGGRVMEATVVGAGQPPPGEETRPLLGLLPQRPVLPPDLVGLAFALSAAYLCPPALALRAVSPPGMRVEEKGTVRLAVPPTEAENRGAKLRSPRALRLLELLRQKEKWPLERLEAVWDQGASTLGPALRLLERHGLARVERRRRPQAAPPAAGVNAPPPATPETVAEAATAEAVRAAPTIPPVESGSAAAAVGEAPVLLWGGDPYARAEVYREWAEECVSRGEGVVALAPEKEQVEQLVSWWRPRLRHRLAVLHSGIPPAGRYREWLSLAGGGARVALGTRSAVFAPLSPLGLVVVEREHDPAYKQEEAPRYHAREVARWRSPRRLVLGSSTPQLETFFAARRGEYVLRKLPSPPSPPVTVVDLRLRAEPGLRRVLSAELRARLRQCVARRQRAILLLNRRGYAGGLVCRECGQALACPRCRIGLTYHAPGWLRCHLCGFSRSVPDLCPFCGGRGLSLAGVGIQRVEEELRRLLPGTLVLRLDSDVAGKVSQARAVWQAFLSRRPSVLVGTRMVAGAAEAPELGLVGVVNADVGLHHPDFRAAERSFSLLYDLGELAVDWGGEFLLQTYHPEHHALRAAAAHDYLLFYGEEIRVREELGYPPFSHLARVVCAAAGEEEARRGAEEIASCFPASPGVEVLGPAPAPLSPLRGEFRWVVVGKGVDRQALRESLGEALAKAGLERRAGLRVTVDVDPYDML